MKFRTQVGRLVFLLRHLHLVLNRIFVLGQDPDPKPENNYRQMNYNKRFLVNSFLEKSEAEMPSLTMGYPAWNLLYYTFVSSFFGREHAPVVIETGTNLGLSTIVLAQGLKDLGLGGVVHTVDISADNVAKAKATVEAAGLSEYVCFHVGDALEFLVKIQNEVAGIDFLFLDDWHERGHVLREFSAVYRKVKKAGGKIYFDNSAQYDVEDVLWLVRRLYGGNVIHFRRCSWGPPGNAIWAP